MTSVGVVYSWTLFRRFEVNVFDYAETNDFLLAAFKDPLVFVMTFLTILTLFAVVFTTFILQRQRTHSLQLPAPVKINNESRTRRFQLYRSMMFFLTIFLTVLYTAIPPFLIANNAANAMQEQTEGPRASVQYRAISSSQEQKKVTDLRVIGTTQNFAFFYDRSNARTLIIPHAQIVEIEIVSDGEQTTSAPSRALASR